MELFDFENKEKADIIIQVPEKLLKRDELKYYLSQLKVDYLKSLYKFFFGKGATISKAELIRVISEYFNFSTAGQFREWFFGLPLLTQKILHRGAFYEYLSIPVLEDELKITLLDRDTKYSWKPEWQYRSVSNLGFLLKPELKLGFLLLHAHYGCPFLVIPRFLRQILRVWLVPPDSLLLSNCRTTEQSEVWDSSILISDIYPLLCDALKKNMEEMEENHHEKPVKNGFNKKEINELQASTGFLPFKIGGHYAPSGVDMLARFILCMRNFNPCRPEDGQDGIKDLTQAFFGEKTIHPRSWNFPDCAYLEYYICLDHLSRTPGFYTENNEIRPVSRKVFLDILLYIARDGNWFDVDKLAEYIRATGRRFIFCEAYMESRLKVKAETFEFDNITLTASYDGEFHTDGIMRYYLLVRPLLKAYCYIFAALGLLEITQIPPPLVRSYRKKQYPFSMYDSLKAIRITELGRWCLGLTDKQPPKPSREYQAIADRELLLVTVQGNSLERQVYLDKIGRRLGEDRWRISHASFIAGCVNKRQITERIELFKFLIDPNPAPHWEQLFRKTVDRAGLFDTMRSDMLIFDLPEDREIQKELLHDPEIKRIIRRIEGNMLAISARDRAKFYGLLCEHGIAHF